MAEPALRLRRCRVLVVLAAAVAVPAAGCATGVTGQPPAGSAPPDAQRAEVVSVADGETVDVRAVGAGPLPEETTTVRLLEVDTPETVHPDQPVECYGPQASRFTKTRLAGKRVWLQTDAELRGRYNRALRYLWLDAETHFNVTLVERGYATASLYEPNDRHWDQVSAAEADARDAGRGLWGACAGPDDPASGATPGGSGGQLPRADPAGPDLDCSDVDGPVRVGPSDPHRLDGNGDGIGCE